MVDYRYRALMFGVKLLYFFFFFFFLKKESSGISSTGADKPENRPPTPVINELSAGYNFATHNFTWKAWVKTWLGK